MKKIPTIGEVIAGEAFANWRQAQGDLQQQQQACTAALVACGLAADACTVEQFAHGELHLAAASPAAAARLRQSLPTFMHAARRAGLAVHTCHIVAVRRPAQTAD